MGNSVLRSVTVGALALGLPLACLGGVLAYGKMLTDAEVAEGRVVSPEEARSRARELAQRFAAMSPREHLAAARDALARGYDAASDTGGDTASALHHLGAVADAAPERAEADALIARATRRAERTRERERRRVEAALAGVSQRIVATAPSADERARLDDDDLRERRVALAHALDRAYTGALGCIHAEGEGTATLLFAGAGCDQARLDRVVTPASREALQTLGFATVRCGCGGASVAVRAGR